jgi:hypothetical protein
MSRPHWLQTFIFVTTLSASKTGPEGMDRLANGHAAEDLNF